MNRRRFIHEATGALLAARFIPFLGRMAGSSGELGAQSIPPAVRDRIGITTVCFRDRFAATRAAALGPLGEDALTLLTAPKFIADQLGLHNVEVWNRHFADMSLDYCREVRAAAAAAGSTITNIQLDGAYDLSSTDATRRAESIALVKGWMDRAAAVGAPRMRANTGGRPADPVSDQTVDSYRQLAAYGRNIGVKILVENHDGSSEIPRAVEVVRRVNDPYCRSLADWGNTPSDSQAAREAALKEMLPYLEFISAKEVDFDAENRHVSYDVIPIIRMTEASGFRGIYSIEFFGQRPPADVVAAAKTMVRAIAEHIKG